MREAQHSKLTILYPVPNMLMGPSFRGMGKVSDIFQLVNTMFIYDSTLQLGSIPIDILPHYNQGYQRQGEDILFVQFCPDQVMVAISIASALSSDPLMMMQA